MSTNSCSGGGPYCDSSAEKRATQDSSKSDDADAFASSTSATGAARIPLTSAPPNVQSLVRSAQSLYDDTYFSTSPPICTVAPGRVNLIGEHTDYTGGFVLPMAIGYSTVCYGKGRVEDAGSAGAGKCCVISGSQKGGGVVKFFASHGSTDEKGGEDGAASEAAGGMDAIADGNHAWANYVLGVVAQYMPDLPDDRTVSFDLAIAGDVPLGSGLSSSASLEVAVATFLECLISRDAGPDVPFSSSERVAGITAVDDEGKAARARAVPIERALRCQRAENVYCGSPCGIMDQFVSSCGEAGKALLIDCRSHSFEEATLGTGSDVPSVVVTNSNVVHSIGGGEYPKRVQQCAEATEALRNHQWTIQKYLGKEIKSLRDASPGQVEAARGSMDEVAYKRAKHVTTENERTVKAKGALDEGDWEGVGVLMSASHQSMRDDYEVSCEEIDVLVDLAQSFPGVYGSRLTGGGFGGCTVSLVNKEQVGPLMEHLKNEYKSKIGKDCTCFETCPGDGAREIVL